MLTLAKRMYYGGTVLTMEDILYAQALLVEDGVIRAEAAPLEADADLRTVVLQYLKGPASPELRTPLPADWALESIGLTEGTAELVKKIAEILGRESRRVTLLLPYDKAGIADTLRREAAVLSVEYGEDGVTVEAVVKPELWGLVRGYVQEGE